LLRGAYWGLAVDPHDSAGAVTRLDLANHAVEKRFRTGPGVLPGQITFGHHAAWVENVGDASILRIDADTDRVTRIPVGSHPTDIAVAFGSVWVPSSAKNAVWRINAVTNAVEAIIPVGRSPIALATGSGAVGVTNQGAGTVSRIDPRTNRVRETIRLGFSPHGLAVEDGAVWVAVARRPL
jgi:virginiamycin B lyase